MFLAVISCVCFLFFWGGGVKTFTQASLSASWRISLHIVPNDLLNTESYYYYYYYYYYYTASCIISLWEGYHSIPHPPRGKVIPLQDLTYVTPRTFHTSVESSWLRLWRWGHWVLSKCCACRLWQHSQHFQKHKGIWTRHVQHFGKCCTCRLKCTCSLKMLLCFSKWCACVL